MCRLTTIMALTSIFAGQSRFLSHFGRKRLSVRPAAGFEQVEAIRRGLVPRPPLAT